MKILGQILEFTAALIILFIGLHLVYFIVKTLTIMISHGFKENKRHIAETRYSDNIEFIKWVIIDVFRGKDYYKLFGIWCFAGYYGQGKSLGAVNFAFNLKKKYPYKDIKIYSNYDIVGQDGRIKKWQDLLDLPKNTIVIFDEIQSTFSSQKYKDFPIDLLWQLTQCRKKGLAIFCTSPVYSRMTIQLRESTDYVIECKNIFKLDRMFKYDFYHAPDYESYIDNAGGILDKLKKRQFRDQRYTLVAQDANYEMYNTEQIIDRWDIEDANQKDKKVTKYTYDKLRNELLKEIDNRMKKAS